MNNNEIDPSPTPTAATEAHIPELSAPELRQRHSSTYSYSYVNGEQNTTPQDCRKPKEMSKDEKNKNKEEKEEDEDTLFECNVCLATASEPVVTMCGHLYCWPCLSRWMNSTQAKSNTCPVCNSLITKDKIIPIYAKGASQSTNDPRKRDFTPNDGDEGSGGQRPQGQRTEAPNLNQNPFSFFPFNLGGGGGGVRAGEGNIQFNNVQGPGRRQRRTAQGNAVDDIGGFMSRLFLMLATLILVSIILY